MGNRCPDCGKFVGLEQGEPELSDIMVDGDRVIGTVRLVLSCTECGSELKEATLDVDIEIPANEPETREELEALETDSPEPPEYEVIEESVEATDRYEGKGRYAKHFYGATVSVTVRESALKPDITVEDIIEEQASSFEDLT